MRLVGEGIGGKEPKKRPEKASTKATDNNEPLPFDNARANALSASLESLQSEVTKFNDNKGSHYIYIEAVAKQAVDAIRELKETQLCGVHEAADRERNVHARGGAGNGAELHPDSACRWPLAHVTHRDARCCLIFAHMCGLTRREAGVAQAEVFHGGIRCGG